MEEVVVGLDSGDRNSGDSSWLCAEMEIRNFKVEERAPLQFLVVKCG